MVAPGDQDIFLGLRWLVAGVLVCLISVWISGLLLIAGRHEILPRSANRVAVGLSLASAAAGLAALSLVDRTPMRWLLVFVAIPPIMAAYIGALYAAPLRRILSSAGAQLTICAAIAAITFSIAIAFLKVNTSGLDSRAATNQRQKEWQAREKDSIWKRHPICAPPLELSSRRQRKISKFGIAL